jgi:aldehyde:ferredoxin oxidoreductase
MGNVCSGNFGNFLEGMLLDGTSRIKDKNGEMIRHGNFVSCFGHLGILAIIVEGKAPEGELYLLKIDEKGDASLEDASEYKGARTYGLVEDLLKKYGEKNGVLCIGPAGEARMAAASIQSSDVDGRPCRAAGRGGLGAVMGSKGLKALVVDQRGETPAAVADPETFKEADFGRLLGSGPSAVGAHFGHHRVPVVKGQSIAAYDPRAMKGNGVTYATCPMGADHTAGNVIGEYMEGKLDALKPDGQMEASRNMQIALAAVDCTGLRLFASFPLKTPEGGEAFLKAMNARFGTSMGPESVPELGTRVIRA